MMNDDVPTHRTVYTVHAQYVHCIERAAGHTIYSNEIREAEFEFSNIFMFFGVFCKVLKFLGRENG